MLVSIKSVIKGHHVYKNTCEVGTLLQCTLEPENEYSDSAIIVKRCDNNSIVGHVPEGLCQPLTKLVDNGRWNNGWNSWGTATIIKRHFCERRWNTPIDTLVWNQSTHAIRKVPVTSPIKISSKNMESPIRYRYLLHLNCFFFAKCQAIFLKNISLFSGNIALLNSFDYKKIIYF